MSVFSISDKTLLQVISLLLMLLVSPYLYLFYLFIFPDALFQE